MTDPTQALTDECRRQEENCAYTATSFIIWLRCLRWVRTFCLTAPVVFGALATWKVLEQSSIWAAVFTLLATVIPPTYRGSRLDDAIKDYETMSASSPTSGIASGKPRWFILRSPIPTSRPSPIH